MDQEHSAALRDRRGTDRTVISADSHVMEPADLWTSRLDAGLRDEAPEVRKNPDGPGYSFHAPGLPPSKVAGAWGAGRSGEELKQHLETAGYESARPSGWDPAERLKVAHYAFSLGHQRSIVVLLDTQEMMTSTYQLAGDELEDYRRFAGDGLFRLSVGLEAPDDLIDDLDQALSG